jgi:hypothetical protein
MLLRIPIMALSPLNPLITQALADWKPEVCKTPRRAITFPLNYARSDAEQIIEYLGRFALEYGHSPCVFKFARCLIRNISDNNAQAMHFNMVGNFVLTNVTYVSDPRGAEYVRSPLALIKEYAANGFAQGDCDDMVLLTNSLCNALGMRTRVMAVKSDGSASFNHVLSMIEVGGIWKWFDGCNKLNPTKAWDSAIMYQI